MDMFEKLEFEQMLRNIDAKITILSQSVAMLLAAIATKDKLTDEQTNQLIQASKLLNEMESK